MKITKINSIPKEIKFFDLDIGSIVQEKMSGNIYIKTSNSPNSNNAINLQTGEAGMFNRTNEINLLDVELIYSIIK